LVALTVAGWAVAGLTALGVLAGVVPTVLLAGVLGLGRRAVVQGQAAEVEWQRRITEAEAPLRERAARPGRKGAAGRAVRPSLDDTQAITRVRADQVASSRSGDGGREGDSWSPVAVPRPTYATKAAAPRREPVPLGTVEGSTHDAPARRSVTERPAAQETVAETSGVPATPVADVPAGPEETPVPAPAAVATPEVAEPVADTAPAAEEPTGSIDLDAVLARRRAAGA
ncbi:hypothetical protein EBM89_08725, partial [Cellulomonas triticagri]